MARTKAEAPSILKETDEVKQFLDKAIESHEKGHYALSIPEFERRANEGYPRGQLWLGIAYRDGHGIGQNGEKAIEWFALAATSGLAEADYLIAEMYHQHICIKGDYAKRDAYYEKAAKGGNIDAMFKLAKYIYDRTWAPEEATQAIEWLCKIAVAENASTSDQHTAWSEIHRLSTDILKRHFAFAK